MDDPVKAILLGAAVVGVGAVVYYVMKDSGPKQPTGIKKVVTETFQMTSDASVGGFDAAEKAVNAFKNKDFSTGISSAATAVLDYGLAGGIAKAFNSDNRTENRLFSAGTTVAKVFFPPAAIVSWFLPGARMLPKHELAEYCEDFLKSQDLNRGMELNMEYFNDNKVFPGEWTDAIFAGRKNNYTPGKILAVCTSPDDEYKWWADTIHRDPRYSKTKKYITNAAPMLPRGKTVAVNPKLHADPQGYLKELARTRFNRVQESMLSGDYWEHVGDSWWGKIKGIFS